MENSAYMSLEQNATEPRTFKASQPDPFGTDFTHQPITHSSSNQKQQMAMFKKFVRNIELQQRKKTIQKTQQIKKQLLQAQIASKNFRSELLRPSSHIQPNRQIRESYKNSASQKKIVLQRNQKSLSTEIIKAKPQQILKLQAPTLKGQPYVSKDKLIKKPLFGNAADKEKENRVKQPPRQFSGIRLRNLKLPELNVDQTNGKKQGQEKQIQRAQDKQKIHKQRAIANDQDMQTTKKQRVYKKQSGPITVNPVLKTFENRYFGIEKEKKDYEKVGRNLLESVMQKYWNYDSVENQEVYENFEDYLADLAQAELLK